MNEYFRPAKRDIRDSGRFDPTPEKSFTLPSDWYFTPGVYRAEHDAIFYRTWIYQGHRSDLANPGDYFVGQVADQGIFVIKDANGELRAFYNVCSHRAHPLLSGAGNARLIVCPYHQWCYEASGKFRGARGRDALKEWIPDNANLKEIRLEDFGGFLFVNLDPDAKPLADQAGALLGHMRDNCPQLETFVRAERYELDIAANWKTVIDNNHECYHCQSNHKTLMELVDYDNKAVWSDSGITFSHAVEKKTLDNGAYQLKPEEIQQEALFGYIWPTVIPLMYPGSPSIAMFSVIPTGTETTRERWDFYLTHPEPNDQERRFIDYIKNVLIVEDIGLCEGVQKGLHSRGYRQGRFVVNREHSEFSEHHVHFFQKFVFDALNAAGNLDAAR
jgi:choline monooxygenase